jgi:hypothetical protein
LADNLSEQRVGGNFFENRDVTASAPGTTNATDTRILILTFACRADYLLEVKRELAEAAKGEGMPSFYNAKALAIVSILQGAPTPREAVIIKATLAVAVGE